MEDGYRGRYRGRPSHPSPYQPPPRSGPLQPRACRPSTRRPPSSCPRVVQPARRRLAARRQPSSIACRRRRRRHCRHRHCRQRSLGRPRHPKTGRCSRFHSVPLHRIRQRPLLLRPSRPRLLRKPPRLQGLQVLKGWSGCPRTLRCRRCCVGQPPLVRHGLQKRQPHPKQVRVVETTCRRHARAAAATAMGSLSVSHPGVGSGRCMGSSHGSSSPLHRLALGFTAVLLYIVKPYGVGARARSRLQGFYFTALLCNGR